MLEKKNIYLGIQVVEKPQPDRINNPEEQKSLAYKSQLQNLSETPKANFGQMEFELFGWYFFKVNLSDGNIAQGRWIKKLYEPPLRRPSTEVRGREIEAAIEFQIDELDYDDKAL